MQLVAAASETITIPNPTWNQWTSALDVYNYLFDNFEARKDLLTTANKIRRKGRRTILAEHPLLKAPLVIQFHMTNRKLREEVRRELLLFCLQYPSPLAVQKRSYSVVRPTH